MMNQLISADKQLGLIIIIIIITCYMNKMSMENGFCLSCFSCYAYALQET